MSDVGCLSVPYWYLFCSLFTLMIKYSEVQHFADDINLLNFSSCVKYLNKKVNYDLKKLTNWLKATKISLNVGKTKLVIFTSSKK